MANGSVNTSVMIGQKINKCEIKGRYRIFHAGQLRMSLITIDGLPSRLVRFHSRKNLQMAYFDKDKQQ